MKKYLLTLAGMCALSLSSLGVTLTPVTTMQELLDANATLGDGVARDMAYSLDTVYNFTGNGAILNVSHTTLAEALAGSGNVVVAAWVKPSATTAMTIFSSGGDSNGFSLGLTGDGTLRFSFKGGDSYDATTIDRSGNTWTFVAVAFPLNGTSSSTQKGRLYVSTTDGQFWTKDMSGMTACDPSTFAIGSTTSSAATEAFTGSIANLMVFTTDSNTELQNSGIASAVGSAPAPFSLNDYSEKVVYLFDGGDTPTEGWKNLGFKGGSSNGGIEKNLTQNNSSIGFSAAETDGKWWSNTTTATLPDFAMTDLATALGMPKLPLTVCQDGINNGGMNNRSIAVSGLTDGTYYTLYFICGRNSPTGFQLTQNTYTWTPQMAIQYAKTGDAKFTDVAFDARHNAITIPENNLLLVKVSNIQSKNGAIQFILNGGNEDTARSDIHALAIVKSTPEKFIKIVDMKGLVGENPTLGTGVKLERSYPNDTVYSFTGEGAITGLTQGPLAETISSKFGNLVIAAWVKVPNNAGEKLSIFGSGASFNSENSNGFRFAVENNGTLLTFKSIENGNYSCSPSNPNAAVARDGENWTLVAVTIPLNGTSNNTKKGARYISGTDGQCYGKDLPAMRACDPATFAIGSSASNADETNDEPFQGLIANLTVFSLDMDNLYSDGQIQLKNSDIAAAMGPAPVEVPIDLSGVEALAARLDERAGTTGAESLASKVTFEVLDADEEQAQIVPGDDKFTIQATSARMASFALGHYIREIAGGHISWCGSRFPTTWPLPTEAVTVKPLHPYAIAYNYCTLSYTMAFWGQDAWQEEIDRLALQGYNIALVTAGLQKVWQLTLTDMGYSDEQIEKFITDDAISAWWHMGNLQALGNPNKGTVAYPVNAAQIDLDGEYGAFIVKQMRAVGIEPIIQSFVGLIPSTTTVAQLEEVEGVGSGHARIFTLGYYGNYGGNNNANMKSPDLLDPTCKAFEVFSAAWNKNLATVYGFGTTTPNPKYLGGDLFHESDPNGMEKEDIRASAINVQTFQQQAFPNATWVLQSWQSSPNQNIRNGLNPAHTLIEYLDQSMHNSGTINYTCQNQSEANSGIVGAQQKMPWVWCEVMNFGGNTGMHGAFSRFKNMGKISTNDPLFMGYGLLSEGLETNPSSYDLFANGLLAQTAATQNITDEDAYLADYRMRRYGLTEDNTDLRDAHKLCATTVWNCQNGGWQGCLESVFCAPPAWNISKVSSWGPDGPIAYDREKLVQAARHYLAAAKAYPTLLEQETFKYDFVEIFQQILADKAREMLPDCENNSRLRNQLREMIRLLDEILACSDEWRLDKKEERLTKVAVGTDAVAAYRRMVTTWTPATYGDTTLCEYAHRSYAGLIKHYYGARWLKFLDKADGKCSDAEYNNFVNNLAINFPTAELAATPTTGNPIAIAEEILGVISPKVLAWNGEAGDNNWESANWTSSVNGETIAWEDESDVVFTGVKDTVTADASVTIGNLELAPLSYGGMSSATYIQDGNGTDLGWTGIKTADELLARTYHGYFYGKWMSAAHEVPARYLTKIDDNSIEMQFQIYDGNYTKVVELQLTIKNDGHVWAKHLWACNEQSVNNVGQKEYSSDNVSDIGKTEDNILKYAISGLMMYPASALTIRGPVTIAGEVTLADGAQLKVASATTLPHIIMTGTTATLVLGESQKVTVSALTIPSGGKLVIQGTASLLWNPETDTQGVYFKDENGFVYKPAEGSVVYVCTTPDDPNYNVEQELTVDSATGAAKRVLLAQAMDNSSWIQTTAQPTGWTNISLDELAKMEFTGTMDGDWVAKTSARGYWITKTPTTPTAVTVQMQAFDDPNVKCVIIEFTLGGASGNEIYARATRACFKKDGTLGEDLSSAGTNDDTANGTITTSTPETGENKGYGIFGLTATPAVARIPSTGSNYASFSEAYDLAKNNANDKNVSIIADTTLSDSKSIKDSVILTIEKGATLTSGTTDLPDFNGTSTIIVKGTVDMAKTRWTISTNNQLELYAGAQIIGTGEQVGALEIHATEHTIPVHAAEGHDPAEILAPFRTSDSIVFDVDEDVTLLVKNFKKGDDDGHVVKKTGLGTIVYTGSFHDGMTLTTGENASGTVARELYAGEVFSITKGAGDVVFDITSNDPDYKVVETVEDSVHTFTTVAKEYVANVTEQNSNASEGDAGTKFEDIEEAKAYLLSVLPTDPTAKLWLMGSLKAETPEYEGWCTDTSFVAGGIEVWPIAAMVGETPYRTFAAAVAAAKGAEIVVVDASFSTLPTGWTIQDGKLVAPTVYYIEGDIWESAIWKQDPSATGEPLSWVDGMSAVFTDPATVTATDVTAKSLTLAPAVQTWGERELQTANHTYAIASSGTDLGWAVPSKAALLSATYSGYMGGGGINSDQSTKECAGYHVTEVVGEEAVTVQMQVEDGNFIKGVNLKLKIEGGKVIAYHQGTPFATKTDTGGLGTKLTTGDGSYFIRGLTIALKKGDAQSVSVEVTGPVAVSERVTLASDTTLLATGITEIPTLSVVGGNATFVLDATQQTNIQHWDIPAGSKLIFKGALETLPQGVLTSTKDSEVIHLPVESVYYVSTAEENATEQELMVEAESGDVITVPQKMGDDWITSTATPTGWTELTLDDLAMMEIAGQMGTTEGASVAARAYNFVYTAETESLAVTMTAGDKSVDLTFTVQYGEVYVVAPNQATDATFGVYGLEVHTAEATVTDDKGATYSNYRHFSDALTVATADGATAKNILLLTDVTISSNKGLKNGVKLTIPHGVAVTAGANDVPDYDNSCTIVVQGTLNMASYRWSVDQNCRFELYTGGQIIGAGQGNLFAIDLFEANSTIYVRKAEGFDTANFEAPIRHRVNDGFTIDVEEGATVIMGGIPSGDSTTTTGSVTKTGKGTMILNGSLISEIPFIMGSGESGVLQRALAVGDSFKVQNATASNTVITSKNEAYMVVSSVSGTTTTYKLAKIVAKVVVGEQETPYPVMADAIAAYEAAGEGAKLYLIDAGALPEGWATTETILGAELWRIAAKIGDTPYPTILDAIHAAAHGQTVTLWVDCEEDLDIGKAITLNWNGKKLLSTVKLENAEASVTGTILGSGTLILPGGLPKTLTGLTDADNWVGTLVLNGNITFAEETLADYGNENSAIKLAGTCTGYLARAGSCAADLILSGSMTFNNGWSSGNGGYTFTGDLTGTGSLITTVNASRDDVTDVIAFTGDASGFKGTITVGGGKCVAFGSGYTDKDGETGYENTIQVGADKTVTIAEGKTWTAANGITVAGTIGGAGTVSGAVTFADNGVLDASANTQTAALKITGAIKSCLPIAFTAAPADGTLVLCEKTLADIPAFTVTVGGVAASEKVLTQADENLAITTIPSGVHVSVNGSPYASLAEAFRVAGDSGTVTITGDMTVETLDLSAVSPSSRDKSTGVKLAFAENVVLTVEKLILGTNRDFMGWEDEDETDPTYDKTHLVVTDSVEMTEGPIEGAPLVPTWTMAPTVDVTLYTLNYVADDSSTDANEETGKLTNAENGGITMTSVDSVVTELDFLTSLTGKGCWYEWTFDKETTLLDSTGRNTTALGPDTIAEADCVTTEKGYAVKLATRAVQDHLYYSESLEAPNWSSSFFARMPSNEGGVLVSFGSAAAKKGNGCLALVRGKSENQVVLVYIREGRATFEVLADMKVPHAETDYHLYSFVVYGDDPEDDADDPRIEIFLDESLWITVKGSYSASRGVRFGALYYYQWGGANSESLGTYSGVVNGGSLTLAEAEASETAAIDMLRIYDCYLTEDEVTRIAAEYAYESPYGEFTREIQGSANWVTAEDAADAWLKNEQAKVTYPVEGKATLTVTDDATVTVNMPEATAEAANVNLESLTLTGRGAVTFAAVENAQHITVTGNAIIETDATVDCMAISLEGPVNVAPEKTLTLTLTKALLTKWETDHFNNGTLIRKNLTGYVVGTGSIKFNVLDDEWKADTDVTENGAGTYTKEGWTLTIQKDDANSWVATLVRVPWEVTIAADNSVSWKPYTPPDWKDGYASLENAEINIHAEGSATLTLNGPTPKMTVAGSGTVTLAYPTEDLTIATLSLAEGANVLLDKSVANKTTGAELAANSTLILQGATDSTSDTITLPITGAGSVQIKGNVTLDADNSFIGGITVTSGSILKTTQKKGFGGNDDKNTGMTIVVEAGGAVDVNNTKDRCYAFSIAGEGVNGSGAIFNSGDEISTDFRQAHTITLTGDATIVAGEEHNWGLVNAGYEPTALNLANHTLTKCGNGTFFACNTSVTNGGKILVEDGELNLFTHNKSGDGSAGSATYESVSFRLSNKGILTLGNNMTVSDEKCASADVGYTVMGKKSGETTTYSLRRKGFMLMVK